MRTSTIVEVISSLLRKYFLIFLLVVSFQSSMVLAYRCEQPKSFTEEYNNAIVIFSGEISDILKLESAVPGISYNVEFDVDKVWKGNLGDKATVGVDSIGGRGYGFCDVELKIGEKYLVYAYLVSAYGQEFLSTNICTRGVGICSRTNLLSSASKDLSALEQGVYASDVSNKSSEEFKPSDSASYNSENIIIVGLIFIIVIIMIIISKFSQKM